MARLDLFQGLRQEARQQMLLQPRMLQAIEVLQLPGLELEAWLKEAAEENAALSVDLPGLTAPRGSWEDTERHDEMLRNQPERGASLAAYIEEQLALAEIEEGLRPWVRLLADCLDENGYLAATDEELLALAEGLGLERDEGALGRAIASLQRLEPRGIGGRDLVEALLLQLDPSDPDYPALCVLLEQHLESLAQNKLPAVARAMGIDLNELEQLLELLRDLDPRPAAGLVESGAPVLHPDVVVERLEEGGYEVRLERSSLPSVEIDTGVQALAADKTQPKEVRKYLRGKIEEARWLVDAIEQRGKTLLRTARALFAHQHAFLDDGPASLQPLSMTALAEELSLHVSTISRAVSGKHVQTPHGIYPLRWFFQSESAGGGARENVREEVRKVIADEDPHKPLSDDEIVTHLASRGLNLARRTVAKYRKELGIQSSYRRRRFTS